MKRLDAFGDRIVVEATPRESESPGGIVLPDVAAVAPPTGRIVSIAKGIGRSPAFTLLRIGAEVMFEPYAGHEIALNGKTLRVLRINDIVGVLTEVEPATTEETTP